MLHKSFTSLPITENASIKISSTVPKNTSADADKNF